MRLTVILWGVNCTGRYRQGKWQTVLHWKALGKCNSFFFCGWNFSPSRTAQPHRGSNQLLQWQWPFASSDWHFTKTLTQQFLVCSTSAAWRVGDKYSYIHYRIHLLCAHHPPSNKRNKCTSYRDLFMSGLGRTTAWLLLPAQAAWSRLRMSLTSSSLPFLIIFPALLIFPAAWRAVEIPGDLSQVSFPALLGLPDSPQPLLLAAERWHWQSVAGGGEQLSHHQAAGGTPQAHRCIGGLGSCALAFPNEKQQSPALTFPKLSFHWQKNPWQFIKLFWRKWLCLMEMGCTDSACLGSDQAVPGEVGLVLWLTQDSWQFWQLTAGKWLICLLLPPLCLSVCLRL